ncbi:MetQ/NlpA family ABC transporter substrate-binding protein [Lysinibacillus sp. NPDC093190]|uniref:MetQ/NlpA family ABC transporter substrate-binding protein n=1 Tax=Lysinibacillus sp. NPDC093190 TaxID=3390575 RepID=UPI003CFEC6E5
MKHFLFLLSTMLLISMLAACNSNGTAQDTSNKTIKIGFTPGPYSDQFQYGIAPILKEKGYTIETIEFSNIIHPNIALGDGSIDANIFQHTAYLENFKKENHLDLTEILKVPTAPMGIYSDRFDSINSLEKNKEYTIAIPNDPANIARALRILDDLGWIELKEGYSPTTVSKQDITKYVYTIEFVEMEQAQLPRSLSDVDFALVNGNFILSSGRKLSSNLALEDPTFEYQNLLAVRTEDKDKKFVKDLIEAYHSADFQKFIESNKDYEGFHRPDYFKD